MIKRLFCWPWRHDRYVAAEHLGDLDGKGTLVRCHNCPKKWYR